MTTTPGHFNPLIGFVYSYLCSRFTYGIDEFQTPSSEHGNKLSNDTVLITNLYSRIKLQKWFFFSLRTAMNPLARRFMYCFRENPNNHKMNCEDALVGYKFAMENMKLNLLDWGLLVVSGIFLYSHSSASLPSQNLVCSE